MTRTGFPGPTDEVAAPSVRVLMADADERNVQAMTAVLGAVGFDVRAAPDLRGATSLAQSWRPRALLVDDALPGLDPEGMLELKRVSPGAVLILVGDGWLEAGPGAMPADVRLARPPRVFEIRQALERGRGGHAPAHPAAGAVHQISELVGDSPAMQEIYRLITLAAPSSASVLIHGETGTGKELVARALHDLSARAEGPFVAVSCAALPETLIESELFGHEKGAFTGAAGTRQGRFELADGGTLFLDEVGELPLATQAKLLRALQERTFERLGGTRTLRVDVRIVAATNRALHEEVERGRFRADLFYRLNVLNVRVPPLRERKDDIPQLWDHFVARAAARDKAGTVRTATAALARLLAYDWPGNVRELENVAHHAVTMSAGGTIQERHLPGHLAPREPVEGPIGLHLPGMTMKELEREAILRTYEATGGNAQATADLLEISVRKVRYRLKEYREEGFLPPRADGQPAPPRRPSRPASAEAGPDEPRPERLELARPRLLLAEDDDEVRWSLTAILEQEGYEVLAVPHGAALLEHLGSSELLDAAQTPPDAIITDIRMPGLNGLQVLEGVRAHGWHTPVILITAFGDDETRRRAERLGATAFLDKPLDLERLHQVLQDQVPSRN